MGRSNGGSGGRSTATRVLNLIERRCLAAVLKRNDDARERERSSYQKLHQLPLLNLSVLKLDGSLFEIHVGRTATIAELKQAVEEVFGSFQGKIPWSLVWGHFCLCHIDQKLTNDKACIRVFGIKDGDQLQFIRHMSISNSPLERRSKNGSVPYIQHPKFKYGHEEEEKSGLDTIQEDNTEYYSNGDMEEGHVPEVKVSHFFRGLLSYSKVIGGIKKGIRKQESFFEFPTFRRKRV